MILNIYTLVPIRKTIQKYDSKILFMGMFMYIDDSREMQMSSQSIKFHSVVISQSKLIYFNLGMNFVQTHNKANLWQITTEMF